jgi:hypothetical protein
MAGAVDGVSGLQDHEEEVGQSDIEHEMPQQGPHERPLAVGCAENDFIDALVVQIQDDIGLDTIS